MIHLIRVYVAAGVFAVLALAESGLPPWTIALLAISAPVIPVFVSHLLTRNKLRKQDARVQEIHVLVNSRLSKTLDALSAALIENVRLKDRLGEPVTPGERREAAHPALTSDALPPIPKLEGEK